MKQDNKTTREIALEWFTNLPFDESLNLMFKFYPTREDFDKLTYSEKVELIYLSEHPDQTKKEADLTEGSPDSTNPVHSFLVEENRRLKRLLHDLTPGGSEFVDDPEYCAKWIADERKTTHSELVRQISASKARIVVLEDALKLANDLLRDENIHLEPSDNFYKKYDIDNTGWVLYTIKEVLNQK